MGRLQAWSLESRTRYALLWGGINAAIISSLLLVSRLSYISVGRVLSYLVVAFAVNALAQGFIGYPIARRRLEKRRSTLV